MTEQEALTAAMIIAQGLECGTLCDLGPEYCTCKRLAETLHAQGYAIVPLEAAAVAELMALPPAWSISKDSEGWWAFGPNETHFDVRGQCCATATELLAAVRARLEVHT